MNKKGISALIGWILLIGFTITIAAFVSNWVITQVEKFNPEEVAGGCKIYCEDVSLSIENIEGSISSSSVCNDGNSFNGKVSLKNKGKFSIRSIQGLGQKISLGNIPDNIIKPGEEKDINILFCISTSDNSIEIIPGVKIEEENCICSDSSAVINDIVIENIQNP